MKKLLLFAAIVALLTSCDTQLVKQFPTTVFETSGGDSCATYQQTIKFWKTVSSQYEVVSMHDMGITDAGKPLHLVILNQGKAHQPKDLAQSEKTVLFINNGIHPGEPDGIEACKLLAKQLLQNKEAWKDVIIALTPVYNIGGMLQRNNYTRANQEGPAEYGFRGNAQNLDLNRDCIKMDSKNAKALANIFNTIDPDLFFDTHVSNGANYQHVVTLLSTQEQKLGGPLEPFYKKDLTPYLFEQMVAADFPMVPYVNVWGRSPDNGGIDQFFDSPRYTNGYATLHHTPSYTIETHMLKPYKQRVEGTLKLLEISVEYLQNKGQELQALRAEQKQHYADLKSFPIRWKQNREKADVVEYRGYKVSEIPSKVTGMKRMFYNEKKPFTTFLKYRCYYEVEELIKKPNFYVLRGGYFEVVDRLKAQGVTMKKLTKDSLATVSAYYLDEVKMSPNVFEKHHLNTVEKLRKVQKTIHLQKGDWLIATGTDKDRLIVETLEPKAHDSYFVWNFFDAILQQKEGFSPYVWEDKAWELLEANPKMKKAFDKAKSEDEKLAGNAMAQLYWVYKEAHILEENYRLYPVFKLEE